MCNKKLLEKLLKVISRDISKALEGMKDGNVLFNDELHTFYLRLYGVRHIMVKDHSDSAL